MRTILILIISLVVFPFSGLSQVIEEIAQISPFHEELAAIKKGEQWGFINTKGEIVIDYRDDLVISETNTQSYPMFKEGRCIIKQMIDGVYYYGFIDTNGKMVIKPQYLNVTSFDYGLAIVLKLEKQKLGENKILDKNVISYSYEEVVINTSGEEVRYIGEPIHMPFKKDVLRMSPPKIQASLLSSNLAVTKDKNKKLQLHLISGSTQLSNN